MCLWSWFAGSCAYKHYCGVHLWPLWAESVKQRDIERERGSFFFLSTLISWEFGFPPQRGLFLCHFSCSLFLPSVSLSPASGQPVSFSEWLSPLRLRGLVKLCAYSPSPRVTGDAHGHLPSAVLLLSDQSSRRRDNKSRCTPLFAISQPPSL